MDINVLIPEFLVLSLAGSSLSIAAYSSLGIGVMTKNYY